MLEDAVAKNGYQGSEAGNTCTDDCYVRLESRPDTEIDTFPFKAVSAISN